MLDLDIARKKARLAKVNRAILLATQDEDGNEIELEKDGPLLVEHRQLMATLRRLREQRKEVAESGIEDPGETIHHFYYILGHLQTEFLAQKPETKKDIIKRLIEDIQVTNISPHLYLLRIAWIKPIAMGNKERDDVAFLWRSDPVNRGNRAWTLEEENILREVYSSASQLAMLQALPYRTPGQIKKRASELGVHATWKDEGRFAWTMTWADLSVVHEDERDVLIGAGNFQITIGNFTLSAIGVATIAVIVLYQILREKTEPEEQAVETGPEG